MLYFLDTSAILNGALTEYHNVWISPLVIQELENIKNSDRPERIKYLARQAVRDILNSYQINFCMAPEKDIQKLVKKYKFLKDINDHHILCEAIWLNKHSEEKVELVTSDGALILFARQIPEISHSFYEKTNALINTEYAGWGKYFPDEEQMALLYSNPELNVLKAHTNEFCEIFEGNQIKDVLVWDGNRYRPLIYKEFRSILGEKIQPRNLEQKMYLDLLQNKKIPIKLCVAKFGTGKSYLALNYALHEIQVGNFDKIVFVKNNLEVKGAGKLGILPGDSIEKQYPWLKQIEDVIGMEKFEEYIETGIIEPAHLSTLRGRDIKNSIILVDEAENLLTTNIQLLLGRVSENSEIIFCADVKQCDYHNKEDSGIPILIEKLKGHPLFGMVKLLKTERSAVAATADLLD